LIVRGRLPAWGVAAALAVLGGCGRVGFDAIEGFDAQSCAASVPSDANPACMEVGRFARYCGKVNIHVCSPGVWVPDPNCSSGCTHADTATERLAYCQRFYPETQSVISTALTAKPIDVFKNGGCKQITDGTNDSDGMDEFACCAN